MSCLLLVILGALLQLSIVEAQTIEGFMNSIPSYSIQFSESFFQPFYINSTRVVAAAIIGNFLFVGLAVYFLSFLPENRIGASNRRVKEDEEFYIDDDDEEYYDDYYYDEVRRSLVKRSALLLPEIGDITQDYEAEDRATRAQNIMEGVTYMMNYPMARMRQGFSDLYRMYENYWRGVVGESSQKRRVSPVKKTRKDFSKRRNHHRRTPPPPKKDHKTHRPERRRNRPH